MSCYLCSPPANLLISGHSSPLIHEHHVKEFHLGPYKPFKCQVHNCNKSVTVAPFFPLHASAKHRLTEAVRHGSDYLESLTDVMMHYNYYSAGNGAHVACDMVNAIQTELDQFENENGNPSEALDLNEDNPQSQAQGHEASGKPPTSNADSGRKKKGVACLFCTETLPSPSSVKLHEDRRHNLVSNGEFKCDECSRRFHFLSHYRTHLCRLAGFAKEAQPRKEKAKQSVQNKKKKEHMRKPQKGNANFGSSSVSKVYVQVRKRYYFYCSECKETLAEHLVLQHIAMAHIKQTLLKCNGCDYALCYWHPSDMRKHVANVHNGNTTFTDLRANFTQELAELKQKLIRRADGGSAKPYLTKLPGRNMEAAGKSKYCTKCKVWVSKKSMKTHLTGLKHAGVYCLHCNGCQFKTFTHMGQMMLHLKQKHPGTEVGFTDNRAEISEQIEMEEKLYIRDSQM